MQTSTRPALYDYLTRIIGVLASEDQPEPEERNLMLSNVWAEIAGGMMDLALDKESSPLLETLILYSDCGHLTSFTNVLQKERRGSVAFLDLILNPFGSYVADIISLLTTLSDVLLQVSPNDLRGMVQDRNATLALRHFLQVLGGLDPYPAFKQQATIGQANGAPVVNKMSDPSLVVTASTLIMSLIDKIETDNDEGYAVISSIPALSSNQYGSLLVQEFLKVAVAIGDETAMDRVLSSIISDKTGCLTFTEESARWIKKLIYDRNGSHLVEEFFPVLVSKRPNLYKEVYDGCLKGKLAALAAHPSANFVVQKLIQRMPLPPDADVQQGKWSTIEELAEELAPSFERYLNGTAGVILSLVSAASKITTRSGILPKVQTTIWNGLLHAIEAKTGKDTDTAKKMIAKFLIYHQSTPAKSHRGGRGGRGVAQTQEARGKYSPLGCQILSGLWEFDRTYSLVVAESFTGLGVSIVSFAQDNLGSRVVEAFLTSKVLNFKQKNNLFNLMKEHFGELALDKSGSFCVQKCYDVSSLHQKEVIAAELLDVISDLSRVHHGKILCDYCQLVLFQSNKKAWEKSIKHAIARKKQFEEIFEAAAKADEKKKGKGKKQAEKKKANEIDSEKGKTQDKGENNKKRKRDEEKAEDKNAKKQKVDKQKQETKQTPEKTKSKKGDKETSKKPIKKKDKKSKTSTKQETPKQTINPNDILANLGFTTDGKLI